ncbi:MAG TPA: helix-turn-helix domain-containing protein [Terriglobia bacterium]|nr:helix-turn-helix domain-containing protein [Terriglobia bacterium]
MAKGCSVSDESAQELRAAVKAARTADDLRRALCVLLPAVYGLSAGETAAAVGCSTSNVERLIPRFRHSGVKGLQDLRRNPLPPGSAAALRAALGRARSVNEFQRIQCVLLQEQFGLSGWQVAAVVGLPRSTVGSFQSAYRRLGLAGLLAARYGPHGPGAPQGPPAEGTAKKLCAAMTNARGLTEFRQAQCLFLQIVLQFDFDLVARIVGWRRSSVLRWGRRYRREGDEVLRGPGRGRGRWRVMSRARECKVLNRLARGKRAGYWLMFDEIHRAFEEEAGHPLHVSVTQEILGRHGWQHGAVIMIPS